MKQNIKIIIKKILLYIIIIYSGFLLFLIIIQKGMIYYPSEKKFSDCTTFGYDEQNEYKNTKFYEKSGEKKGVIIFFHGNAGSACNRSFIKSLLEKTGNSIIFVEYSGYTNLDNKVPNKEDILLDVKNIGEYIIKQKYENIYVMGRSLGTGPASYLASLNSVDKLLLISSYSQLYKIGAEKFPIFPIKYIFSENYNSEKYLEKYENDILFIHGKSDKVIPNKFGKELYDSLSTYKKKFIDLEGGTHNNIFDNEYINKTIIDYFK